MGFYPDTQIECRTTGDESNGGGFSITKAQGLGVDYSLQNTAEYVYADLTKESVGTPPAPTCTPGAGGSLAAGTYQVKVAWLNDIFGESVASSATSVVVASSGSITVDAPSLSVRWKVPYWGVYVSANGGVTWQRMQYVPGTYVAIAGQGSLPNADPVAWYRDGSENIVVSDLTNWYTPPGGPRAVAYRDEWVVSSVARPFISDDLGNILNSRSVLDANLGSNRFQIWGVDGGKAALDRHIVFGVSYSYANGSGPGILGGAAGGQCAGGGSGGGIAQIIGATGQIEYTGGCSIWLKDDGVSYTIDDILRVEPWFPHSGALPVTIQGYATTRGDDGQATIQALYSNNEGFRCAYENINIKNLIIDCNDLVDYGIYMSTGSEFSFIENVHAQNALVAGIGLGGQSQAYNCQASSNTGDGFQAFIESAYFENCKSYDNDGTGFVAYDMGATFTRCLSYNNGASGFLSWNANPQITHCVSFGNGEDGYRNYNPSNVYYSYPTYSGGFIANNIFASNTGYGISYNNDDMNLFPGPSSTTAELFRNNAFYNNTAGSLNNLSATTNPITLTANPFTSSGTGDFTLNNTSGGGAECKGAATLTNLDVGAYQSASLGGSSATRAFGSVS